MHFPIHESLSYYQTLMHKLYLGVGDQNFSVPDLLVQQQRFATRALKGIRKGDQQKLERNLLLAFCWGMSIPNRFMFSAEEEIWTRFPMLCSYCGTKPCSCKMVKPAKRARVHKNPRLRPKKLSDFQEMFRQIYPPETRTLEHAGVHLAEEMGEEAEAVHAYLSEHKKYQFKKVKEETADFLSCLFGVAISANIDLAKGTAKLFDKNCHACHKAPCVCTLSFINNFKS